MPSVKNASYQMIDVSVIFRCHACRTTLQPYGLDDYWDKKQIWQVGAYHKMQCPQCGAVNKFPSKLINALNG